MRHSRTSVELQNNSRRNDFGKQNPDKSFAKRNSGVKNAGALDANKPTNRSVEKTTNTPAQSTGRSVQDDWKPASERIGNASQVKDNKVSVPTEKSGTRSNVNQNRNANQNIRQNTPATKPAARPASKPATRPTRKRGGGL